MSAPQDGSVIVRCFRAPAPASPPMPSCMSGSDNSNEQRPQPSIRAVSRPLRTQANGPRSELGRQVPVDLEADADFNEGRGSPRHLSSPSVSKWEQGRSGPAAAQAPPQARKEHKRLRSAAQKENR